MEQPSGSIKTVVRIINSTLMRHPELTRFPDLTRCQDTSYEIFINLEALDCIGNVADVEVYHCVDDLMQAWGIVQALRHGSIHYMEVAISQILPVNNGSRVDLPGFSPYLGDIDEISSYFSHDNVNHNTPALQPEALKKISGRIKNILIEKTKEDGNIAVIHLVERDDYGLIIFPGLFETYKNLILREDCLEYCGIPQECCLLPGNCSETMIFVSTIDKPILADEMEGTDHEQ